MSFKTKKEDYKDYVYVRIPKEEYEAIMQDKRKITKNDLDVWRFNYEIKQIDKRVYAKRANRIKVAKTIQKLYKTLENYYLSLFKEENKKLTAYQLSKLAKVNYRTAKKFFEKHKLDEWIDKFEANPVEELKNFKTEELAEYFYQISDTTTIKKEAKND